MIEAKNHGYRLGVSGSSDVGAGDGDTPNFDFDWLLFIPEICVCVMSVSVCV